MSQKGRDDPPMTDTRPDEPQPARALVLRGKGAGAPLSDRIARFFTRMSWRTPFYGSQIGGKLPPRFKAIPVDPLPGDPRAGMALRAGHFLFRALKLPFDKADYARPPQPDAFAQYLHRFDWLRDLAAAGHVAQGRGIAEQLINDWLDVHEAKVSEPAWSAENSAWRFLNWAAYAPFLLSSSDLIHRSRVLRNVSRTARHLDRTAGKAAAGKARLAAWAGVVAASLLLPEGKGRRLVGEPELAKAIDEAIFPDGGVVSRCPLALIEVISLLALLERCYAARKEPVPDFIEAALARAVPALLGLTHADGGLGAWQGSGAMSAERVEALVEISGVRSRPQRQARDWGYQRVATGRSVLLLDAAPPPLARESTSGCASTLAIEFSHGTDRIFINCGGAALTGATIPADLATGLRTTAAHSTLCIADTNSTAILPGGKLGKGVAEVDLDRRDAGDGTRIEVSHDGYARNFGFIHRRVLMMQAGGLQLRGDDILLPTGGRKKRGAQPFHIRFHLGAGVECDLGPDGRSAALRLSGGSLWQFVATEHRLSLEESLWVDEEGIPRPTLQLVIEGEVGTGGSSTGWILKHMA